MIVTEMILDAFAMGCHDSLGVCGSERVRRRDFLP